MQHAGARRVREDDYEQHDRGPGRRLHVVGEVPRRETPADERYAHIYAENGRRTVTITGHLLPPRRRPSPRQAQIQARPDRMALWAFLLGLFLVFMAAATANAAAL